MPTQRSRSAVKRGSVYWITAYPPMTRYLTRTSLKSLNRSLKSELTNIETLDSGAVNDQLPGGVEARLRRLCLPESQIERATRRFQLRTTFKEVRPHAGNDSKADGKASEPMPATTEARTRTGSFALNRQGVGAGRRSACEPSRIVSSSNGMSRSDDNPGWPHD